MTFLYNITPNSTYITVLEVSDTRRETLHDATVYQIDLLTSTDASVIPGFRESDRLDVDQCFIDQLAALPPV